MIKLIVSDIDGTLVDSQGQLLPATITGVQAAVARGGTNGVGLSTFA